VNPNSFMEYGITPKSPNENMTKISNTQLYKLGLKPGSGKMVDKIEDLLDDPPNIIIAECVKTTGFVQNYFKHQVIHKKVNYVMGLGIYQQLVVDKNTGAKVLRPGRSKFRNLYRPYNGHDLNNKTLLVWRTGGIGDLGFIQPNLNYLKEKYPTCKIWFACGPQYQAMVDNWECVDLLLDLPFPISYLHKANYHVLFEGVIERCKQAHTDNAYNLFSRWMGLDLPDELLVPKNYPKQEKLNECREVLKTWNVPEKNFVLLQLRASSPVRTPRPDMWRKIVNVMNHKGYNVIITDSPRQEKMISDFITLVDKPNMVFNFSPYSKTLDYTIALTSLSKLIVCTDSSLTHIAASLDVPSLSIFGPFPGFIRLKTYKNADWVDCKAPCAPCYLHGSFPCGNSKEGHGICYDNLDIQEFSNKFDKIMLQYK